jgi:hypothetical protein
VFTNLTSNKSPKRHLLDDVTQTGAQPTLTLKERKLKALIFQAFKQVTLAL